MQNWQAKLRKYLEIVVNVLLATVCLSLVMVVVKNYVVTPTKAVKSVAVGDKISFPDAIWTKGQKTLLVFLQSGCQYCTRSAAFYKDVVKELSNDSDVKIVAAFSEKDARFQDYLSELGLQNIASRTANFSQIGIEGTPTLMLVDENGIVENAWKGILSPEKQTEVKKKIGLQVSDWFIEEIELSNFKKKGEKITVIDVRDRDSYARNHFAEAINIPADELSVRAPNELSPSEAIAVYGTFEEEGENAQEILTKEGFDKTYVLNYKFH